VLQAVPTLAQPEPLLEQKLPPLDGWSLTLPLLAVCTFSLKYIMILPLLSGKAALELVLAVSPMEAVRNFGSWQSLVLLYLL
jgi:hypothetical protein